MDLKVLEQEILNNSIYSWLIALAVFCFVFLLLRTLRGTIDRFIDKRLAGSSALVVRLVNGMIDRTKSLFLLAVATFSALPYLELPSRAVGNIKTALILIFFVQAGFWISGAAQTFIQQHFRGRDDAMHSALGLISFLLKTVVWAVILLLMLDNVGIDVTALVAGLGVGGIAIALAVQNILSDLLSSLSIILDKPFEVGDTILIDEMIGTVEQIGIKTTRIRSLGGEQIVISNSDLLS
ncbi:MAG: mechanosensitive ion channel, partial [Bdellovibrionales bacterium]|nr:mechanosensitive ion channel [Bdellovibrionales bacterium]